MAEQRDDDWQLTVDAKGVAIPGRQKRYSYTDSGYRRELPGLRYENWCKPNGNLVRIATSNSKNVQGSQDPNRYRDCERRRQVSVGSFPWNYELARALVPGLVGDLSEEAWFKRRAELQLARQTKHREDTMHIGKQVDAKEEAIAKALTTQSDAIVEVISALRESMVKQKKAG